MADRTAFSARRNMQDAPSRAKAQNGLRLRMASLTCAVLSLLAVRPAFAASPSVGDILRKVGYVYSQLQNYHIVARRDEVFLDQQAGSSQVSVIKMDAAPGRIRVMLTGEGPNLLIVSDGKTTWHYSPARNEYTVRETIRTPGASGTPEQTENQTDVMNQMQDLLVGRLVKLWQYEKQATLEGTQEIEFQGRKTPCYEVVFHLENLTDHFWIDQSSFLVLQEQSIETMPSAGRRSLLNDTIRIKEFGANATHPASFFKFTPPSKSRRVAVLNIPGVRESFAGASAGEFTLKDIEGKEVSLSDFRGKTVMLSFWATWCPPCKEELPALQKIHEQHQDVVVLAVDDENKATIRNFLKEKQFGFTALVDRKRTLFKKFSIRFIPTVIVINNEGFITHEVVGWEGPEELLAAIGAGGK
jgi:peroxiredoxin/outer membrane lipoprotein-sorting protein